MTDIKVKGLEELQKFLDQLPAKMEANVLRGSLRSGAKVIANAAKSNVTSVSGELAKSIRVSTVDESEPFHIGNGHPGSGGIFGRPRDS